MSIASWNLIHFREIEEYPFAEGIERNKVTYIGGSMQEISLVRTRKLIFDESMILSFLQISQLPTSNPLGDSFFYLLPQIGQATCSQQNSFGQRSIDEADSIRSENGE